MTHNSICSLEHKIRELNAAQANTQKLLRLTLGIATIAAGYSMGAPTLVHAGCTYIGLVHDIISLPIGITGILRQYMEFEK